MSIGSRRYKKSSRSRKTSCPVCVIYSPNSVFSNSGVSISSQFMLPRSTRPFRSAKVHLPLIVRAQLPVYVAFPFDRAEHLRGVRRSKPPAFRPAPRRRDVRLSKGCIRPCLRSGRSRASVRVPLRTGLRPVAARGSYTVSPLPAGLCMACLPQCPTHLPHSIHFFGSITGSPIPIA